MGQRFSFDLNIFSTLYFTHVKTDYSKSTNNDYSKEIKCGYYKHDEMDDGDHICIAEMKKSDL